MGSFLAMLGSTVALDVANKYFSRPKKLANKAINAKVAKLTSDMQQEDYSTTTNNARIKLANKDRQDKIDKLNNMIQE